MSPRFFKTFAEFEREYLRPARRVGQTFEEMVEDSPFEAEFDFDRDPYEDPDDDDDDDQ
jgi:hypothetical protein